MTSCMEKTIKNLAAAFIGESQARNRYNIYSKIAKKEGLEQIAAIFADTADQEREHAKWLMRMIQDLKEGKGDTHAEILLEAGADPSNQNHHGDTPLHFATLKGDLKIVELLIGHGSNPDIANIRGYTPLHSIALSALSDQIGPT